MVRLYISFMESDQRGGDGRREKMMCLASRSDLFDLECPVTFSGTSVPRELVNRLRDIPLREALSAATAVPLEVHA